MNWVLIVVGAILFVAGIIMSMDFDDPTNEKKVDLSKMESVATRKMREANSLRIPEGEKSVLSLDSVLSDKKYNDDDPKKKGNDFEGYVADLLAANKIKLKQWNQGSTSPGGVYAENELNPDFLVYQKSNSSVIEYWVECKWRNTLPEKGFSLEEYQIKRYQEIQKSSRKKIVIALGVAGIPSAPDEFFVIPLDSLVRFKRIGNKYIHHYELKDPQRNFSNHMKDWFFNEVFKKNSLK